MVTLLAARVRHAEARHPRSAGQGRAAVAARLGFPEVGDVRVGKYIELRLRDVDAAAARGRVRDDVRATPRQRRHRGLPRRGRRGAGIAMRWGVVIFPGSNDDRDALRVAERILGDEAVPLWHKDRDLRGRRLRRPAGRVLLRRLPALRRASRGSRRSWRRSRAHADAGGLVLGICNGFQILCEAGLLPGRAGAQPLAALRLRRGHGAGRDVRHALHLRLSPRRGARAADQARRGLLRRRRGDAGRARGERPGGLPLRRPRGRVGAGGQPQRLARQHRRRLQRGAATSSA